MGSLIGHIVPGTFFLTFSVWWTLNIFSRYFKCYFEEKANGKCREPYKNSSSFLWKRSIKSPGVPVESWLKLVAVIVGMIGEFVTGFGENGQFELHNGQHMTMFGFFAFNAIFELMYHFKVPALPPQLEYTAAVLAFAIEGLLFTWHLEGRKPVDVQVHTFLIYLIVLCCISGIWEMMNPSDVRPALGRSAFTFLQGTWFIHLGFILYPPQPLSHWDLDGHQNMMLVTILFTCHIALAIIFLLLTGLCIYYREKSRNGLFHRKIKLEAKLLDEGNLSKLLADSDTEDMADA